MSTKKRGGDSIDSLPLTSRRILEKAPHSGRYEVPYTVGRVFFLRGWGDHLGKNNSFTGSAMPTSLFQLNADGLQAAETARTRSRAELDRITYAAVYESTTSEISALLEDTSLDQLIRAAKELVERVAAAGNSTAGARGYLDALTEYRDEQSKATA